MTIQAQLPHSPARSARGDHATHGMPAGNPIYADGFALLDHRTRSRTIALGDAPPGRYLSIEHGDEVRLIPLDRPIIHIGRGLTADVRLEDLRVSRRHAIIAQRGDGTRVLDDRSHNGTFLNGRSVTVAYLSDGDVLRVGSVALRFIVVEPQIKPAPLLRRIPLPVRAPGGLVAGSAA
jgi:pSer/pThr/pTyr-binding forkhead associated (FHA) protein